MTSHELAKKLLEGPDVPVATWQGEAGSDGWQDVEKLDLQEIFVWDRLNDQGRTIPAITLE